MTAPNSPSLIQGENQQLKLFNSTEMPDALFAAEETAEQREYTGARLFAKDPERYKAIVALSGEGLGVLRIAKILHVSPHTVMGVREREPECVAIEKSRIAGLSREAARMCVEGILELLCDPAQRKKMGIKELGITFGILAEKHELLSGAPTARVQTIGDPAAVGILEHMQWAREEYERRMGLGAEEKRERAEEKGQGRQAIGAPGAVQTATAEGMKAPGGERATSANGSKAPGEEDRRPAKCPGRRVVALLEAHQNSVGQTPHRSDDMPVNIELKQGV
ncbi:MAG: hypothetical protein WC130_04355 [Kiritimatiellia bacterium]